MQHQAKYGWCYQITSSVLTDNIASRYSHVYRPSSPCHTVLLRSLPVVCGSNNGILEGLLYLLAGPGWSCPRCVNDRRYLDISCRITKRGIRHARTCQKWLNMPEDELWIASSKYFDSSLLILRMRGHLWEVGQGSFQHGVFQQGFFLRSLER
jgi:hypothetical protein